MSITGLDKYKNKQRTVEIRGTTYTYEMLPAFTAFALGAKLIQLFAPALGSLADGWNKKDFVLPEEDTFWTEIAMLLAKAMGDFDVVDTVEKILYSVYRNSEKINPDDEFQGDLSGFLILLESALKENFGDHFLEYLRAKGLQLPTLEDLKKSGKEETITEESQS